MHVLRTYINKFLKFFLQESKKSINFFDNFLNILLKNLKNKLLIYARSYWTKKKLLLLVVVAFTSVALP